MSYDSQLGWDANVSDHMLMMIVVDNVNNLIAK